ncbi:hypothetical protein JMJ77_0006075, partial [Colletotrichum scovillei]
MAMPDTGKCDVVEAISAKRVSSLAASHRPGSATTRASQPRIRPQSPNSSEHQALTTGNSIKIRKPHVWFLTVVR